MSTVGESLAVIICAGSFHTPTHYAPLVEALAKKGITAIAPNLPTMQCSDANPQDLTEIDPQAPAEGWPTGFTDTELVSSEVRKLAESGKRIVLVGHSYGGWLATESAVPELQLTTRIASGKRGGIVGLFYMAGHVLPVGQSVDAFFSPMGDASPPPPFTRLYEPSPDALKKGFALAYDAETWFYHDLPADQARRYATELRPQPIMKSPLTHASYVDLPCAYLLCSEDKVFPISIQGAMVKNATDQGGKMTTYSCSAGHSPFLSWTQGTADAIVDFASKL